MLYLLGLLIIPLLVGGAMFLIYKTTITWKEFLLMEVASIAVLVGGFFFARWGALQDVEHWNGRITKKNHGTMHCCHCRQECCGRDKKGNCNCWREVCAHTHDYYWSLSVSTGDTVVVEDCEPWASSVPKAWTNARIGEPASVAHRFTNYLLADPDSLMHEGAHEEFLNQVPNFPRIHGHYKVNKVIPHGVNLSKQWELGLREMNADLGASKQVDITLLVTKVADPAFAEAVEVKWMYGPKNALIIVAGSPKGKTFEWVRVVSLSRVERLKIELRDKLQGMSLTDPEAGLSMIRKLVSAHFERTPMAEWEYLASSAKPKTWMIILLYILGFVGSVALGFVMHTKDVFGDEGFSSKFNTRLGRRKRRRF